MRPHWLSVPCLTVVYLALGAGFALAGSLDEQALAARLDALLEAGWAGQNVKPAPPADDAEFLRRVYLDLTGRIPHVAEVRSFLQDPAPDKRRQVVDKILASPGYANHFANVWRARMLPNNNTQQIRLLVPQLENWLRERFRDNARYDRMVREVLTAQVASDPRSPPGRLGFDPGAVSVRAFYQANELKPENLAASTSRLFLGVRLECAQCHDHPFAGWKRKQFWEYAAFFAGIRSQQPQAGVLAPAQDSADKKDILIPGTEKVVQARFLDGTEPAWKADVGTRTTLADWLTGADNPYFARAAVNRVWEHLFGVGLIDPVDEMGEENAPSHPELLQELARQFAAHQFDLHYLIRAITASRAYQLTSAVSDPSQRDPRAFARMNLKGLTAEQLYDSLEVATGYRDPTPAGPRRVVGLGGGTRAEFLNKFDNASDKRTESQTSILQALTLMNGRFVADATSLERSETLQAIVTYPFFNQEQRVEALYLAVLSRKPTPGEAARLVAYVERGGPSGDSRKALADVFWALLNSSEFILNH